MSSNYQTKILICTHMAGSCLTSNVYQPILVGKALRPDLHLPFIGDDSGENMSTQNGTYCDLTAHYWAWKNLNADYIGICHYRRYFDFAATDGRINNDMFDISFDDLARRNLGDPVSLLQDGTEVVLVRPSYLPRSVAQNYMLSHVPEDFFILCRVILKLYPEYEPTLRQHFFCSNRWIGYNMMFCRKELFDRYAEWLFHILDETERYVKLSGYSYQKRIFGFMGEILTPLFFLHNCKKIKYRPVLYVSDNPGRVSNLRYLYNKIRYNIAFGLVGKKHPQSADPLGKFYENYFQKDGIVI